MQKIIFSKFTEGSGIIDGFNESVSWIQTYSGRRFDPLNPNYESIVIQDIAHSLSMQCRFSGHIAEFYSVAQHSVGVSYLCNEEDALHGLLHDASEAYLVDIPSPLKKSGNFNFYLDFEAKMMSAVYKRFQLSGPEPDSVKKADKLMLNIEANSLLNARNDWHLESMIPPLKVSSMSPKDAKKIFLKRFAELTNQDIDIYKEYY
jgi:5'-deoxynucleotidase YfbR-like HD superfamily hydrolase